MRSTRYRDRHGKIARGDKSRRNMRARRAATDHLLHLEADDGRGSYAFAELGPFHQLGMVAIFGCDDLPERRHASRARSLDAEASTIEPDPATARHVTIAYSPDKQQHSASDVGRPLSRMRAQWPVDVVVGEDAGSSDYALVRTR